MLYDHRLIESCHVQLMARIIVGRNPAPHDAYLAAKCSRCRHLGSGHNQSPRIGARKPELIATRFSFNDFGAFFYPVLSLLSLSRACVGPPHSSPKPSSSSAPEPFPSPLRRATACPSRPPRSRQTQRPLPPPNWSRWRNQRNAPPLDPPPHGGGGASRHPRGLP